MPVVVTILVVFGLLFYHKKNRLNAVLAASLVIFLGLVAGTRNSGFDGDYIEYTRLFKLTLHSGNYLQLLSQYEPVLVFLPKLLSLLGLDTEAVVQGCFLSIAFCGVFAKLKAIYEEEFFVWSVLLYVSYWFYSQEMITIRAGVASGIFLMSLRDLARDDHKKFFVKIVIAALFHYSSIVYGLVWLAERFRLSIKILLGGLILSFGIAVAKVNLLTILFLDRIFPKVQTYINLVSVNGEQGVNLFNFRVVFGLMMLFFFLISRRYLSEDRFFNLLLRIHILSLILFFALSPAAMVFSLRIFDMLSVAQILSYPYLLRIFKEKIVGIVVLTLICLLNMYYLFFLSGWFGSYTSWLF